MTSIQLLDAAGKHMNETRNKDTSDGHSISKEDGQIF